MTMIFKEGNGQESPVIGFVSLKCLNTLISGNLKIISDSRICSIIAKVP